ncbi:MAG: VWA domain-containing protein [Gammaproteobacteria bacterium]|nr:VWA domain-containing protein [Gammaproteobacteria bacterium]
MQEVFFLWQTLHWQQPYWFVLLLPLLMLYLYRDRGRVYLRSMLALPFDDRHRLYRHPMMERLAALMSTSRDGPGRRWRQMLNGILLLLLYLMLLMALAQPYRMGEEIPQGAPQREIMFVLDSSVSMVLKDYKVDGQRVDRIAMMKTVMQHLLQQLSQNRMGITVFSELSYTLVPMTSDMGLSMRMLQRLQPAMLTGRRSDVGQALISVERELSDYVGEDEVKPLLVLISDVQQSGRKLDPRLVAAHVRKQGYTLHTIAIGAASKEAQDKSSSGLIYQTTNFQLLEQMAERGGGRFFWAKDMPSMQQAVLEIQRSEMRQQKQTPVFIRIPLYHWPLMLALLLLMWIQSISVGLRR